MLCEGNCPCEESLADIDDQEFADHLEQENIGQDQEFADPPEQENIGQDQEEVAQPGLDDIEFEPKEFAMKLKEEPKEFNY